MFDIGWSELLVIAIVALVVIGPKDLPQAFRVMGQWAAKARGMAREFQSHVDEMMREADVQDMKRDFSEMTRLPELDGLESDLMSGELPAKDKQQKSSDVAKDTREDEPTVTTPPAP